MAVCGACAEAKSKQKSLPTQIEATIKLGQPKEKAKANNEQLYLDILSIKPPKLVEVNLSKPHWRIMVDERTGMKWSDFFATKDGMVEPTCVRFQKWKQGGMPVQVVRCDSGGENEKLK